MNFFVLLFASSVSVNSYTINPLSDFNRDDRAMQFQNRSTYTFWGNSTDRQNFEKTHNGSQIIVKQGLENIPNLDGFLKLQEFKGGNATHDYNMTNKEKPSASNISQNLLPLPAGATAALVKPTKYHYYPHNQHIYLLPECAIQQVCNAVYMRLNWTQPLCACPSRYKDPCSASLNSDDHHTTKLIIDGQISTNAQTLVKTCEPTSEMRICRSSRDWSLLALQNVRTGKSHYLVICRCPDTSVLEGPMSHDQPTYASVPGIRVYGMMCVDKKDKAQGKTGRTLNGKSKYHFFPHERIAEFVKNADWTN